MARRPRARDRATAARTWAKDIGGAAGSQAAVKPAFAPIDEAEAIDFVVGSRGFYEALPASAFATPDAGQGRMERELDLILQIEIRPGQEVEQEGQI